jgi:NSS family neurotransmitter:Na+ symporter
MSDTPRHELFSSRFAYLLAATGAAVGLGNLWKFPYMLGSNGGAAFMLVYLAAVFLVALPIMLSEMVLGRYSGLSAPGTFQKLADEGSVSRAWTGFAWFGLLGVFLALSFFSVVGGWSIAYTVNTFSGAFSGLDADAADAAFHDIQAEPVAAVFWHFLFMLGTIVIVAGGIRAGIEAATRIMMPALTILLVAFVAYGAITGAFLEALNYMFTWDFSLITPGTAIAATGQAFFSLSVGVGSVLTYAAYLPKNVSLPQAAIVIAVTDTAVALLAGLAIFPIVFGHGLDPESGPRLLFVAMSSAFGNMPFGWLIGGSFFLLVAIAAITSSIAMLETIVSRAEEYRPGYRRPLTWAIGAFVFVAGLGTVFSFNIWKEVHPLDFVALFHDRTVFGLIDYFVNNLVAPIGATGYAVFAGWCFSQDIARRELAFSSPRAFALWRLLCRYVCPAAILGVLIASL